MSDFTAPAPLDSDAVRIARVRAKLIEQGYDPDEMLARAGSWKPYAPPPFPRSSDIPGPWPLKIIEVHCVLWEYLKAAWLARKRTTAEITAWKAGRISGLSSGLATGRAEGRAQGRTEIIAQLRERGINVDDLLPPDEPDTEPPATP